jgi:hypothetical protein
VEDVELRKLRAGLAGLGVLVGIWAVAAYVLMPAWWRVDEREHGPLHLPKTTETKLGTPGDAVNVALIGAREDLIRAFHAAGWYPADALTLRSSVGIVASVLLDRPDDDAPVSPLFLFGREQDLAFEKPVTRSAKERHHVRFWNAGLDAAGATIWAGAVTYDRSVGLSHETGQVTHHIGPDIDAEREALMGELDGAGWISEEFRVPGVGATQDGRNGGGDRYFTDGEILVGVMKLGKAEG